MADFLKTNDQVKINEIVEKLVRQNSNRQASDEGYFDVPCSSTSSSSADVFLTCPELAGVNGIPDLNAVETASGSESGAAQTAPPTPHIYRANQLVAIGRQVANQMQLIDPSAQQEIPTSRLHLDERLRSAGIYHNRLNQSQGYGVRSGFGFGLGSGLEQGGRGDTDPCSPRPSAK